MYWSILLVRWCDDRFWNERYKSDIAAILPPVARRLLPAVLRRSVKRATLAHGLGRHELETQVRFGKQDIDSCVQLIGDKPFLLGSEPTSYDCSVFAMLEHLRKTPSHHALVTYCQEQEGVNAYCDRMLERIDREASH